MPKANSRRRTGSGRRYWRPVLGLVVLLILLFGWARTAMAPETDLLVINKRQFSYETADTPAEQEKGLGGRASLPADHAMLFRFSTASRRCFWMKDMRFNLDIIWLNAGKKVVQIEPNLSLGTYPQTFCADDSQYVIEVNAGVTQSLHLNEGQTISF